MDSTQGTADDGLVLLDEWQVHAFVAPTLAAGDAEELSEQINADLSSWVRGLPERLGIETTLRVALER